MTLTVEGIATHLDPISKAPSFSDLVQRSSSRGAPKDMIIPAGLPSIEAIMEEESFRRYKAVDAAGSIYEVQNPALMSYQAWQGATVVTRMKPRYIGTVGETKKKKRSYSRADYTSSDSGDINI